MSDLIAFGETSLRLRPAGEGRLETATDVRMEASGVASNVAVAASQLGADATWISKLPDSPLGHRVERDLNGHGIETEIVWDDSGRQSLQFFEPGAAPRGRRHIEDRAGCAIETVTPGELPMGRVERADGVFTAGSTLALSETVRESAGAVLRAAGSDCLVAMDLDYRPGLWSLSAARDAYGELFPAVDVLFASEEGLTTVFGREGNPRDTAHSLASEGDFEMVVITRSEWGALAWHDNVIHELDSVETAVVDPSGQHDAFTGAFFQQVLEGTPVDEALAYGVASAALARTLHGPMTTISAAEIDALATDLQSDR